MTKNLTLRILALSLLFILFGCENEEAIPEILSIEVNHERSNSSNEVTFEIVVIVNDQLANHELDFSVGDGSEPITLMPTGVSEENEATTLMYSTTYIYPAAGAYDLELWLALLPNQKFQRTITLDPFLGT